MDRQLQPLLSKIARLQNLPCVLGYSGLSYPSLLPQGEGLFRHMGLRERARAEAALAKIRTRATFLAFPTSRHFAACWVEDGVQANLWLDPSSAWSTTLMMGASNWPQGLTRLLPPSLSAHEALEAFEQDGALCGYGGLAKPASRIVAHRPKYVYRKGHAGILWDLPKDHVPTHLLSFCFG